MEKEFVPHVESLELKELGFDELCLGYYLLDDIELKLGEGYNIITRYSEENVMRYSLNNTNFLYGTNKPSHLYELSTSPTFSQTLRWFREKCNLHGIISYYGKSQWNIELLNYKGNQIIQIEENTFWTYEEAELECIKQLIKIAKDKL